MTRLTENEILLVHEKIIAATGGTAGVRDRGLLASAVNAPYAGFGEIERYPALEQKAARLAYSLICNHPFTDGNKRTGVLAMLLLLRDHDVAIKYTQPELVELGLGIAEGRLDTEAVYSWIIDHE